MRRPGPAPGEWETETVEGDQTGRAREPAVRRARGIFWASIALISF